MLAIFNLTADDFILIGTIIAFGLMFVLIRRALFMLGEWINRDRP